MELDNFDKCYRRIFEKTNGFVLNWPIGENIRLGDFFSIKPGEFSRLGGIADSNMEMTFFDPYENDYIDFTVPTAEPVEKEDVKIGTSKPSKHLWKLMDGVSSDYLGNKMLLPHKKKLVAPDISQFVTRLKEPGSFFFSGHGVKYHKVLNFYTLHKRFIRRLATQFFNFNEIYLVTEVAHLDSYAIGVSRESNAELVACMKHYFDGDLFDLLHEDPEVPIEKASGFKFLKLRGEEGAIAFKAAKMTLSMKAKELTIKKLYKSKDPKTREHAIEIINNDLASVIPSIEINSSNASDFFEWKPMAMEDMEVFLGGR